MAYTRPIELKDGSLCYEIIVSRGRSQKPVSVRWHPEPEWSQRYTERQLTAFAADLEKRVKAGEVVNKKERKAQREAQEREKAQALTVSAFSEIWLEKISLEVAPGTVTAYRNGLRHQILPSIGSEKLIDVTAPQLASLLTDLQKAYSNSIVGRVFAILSQMFSYAQELGAVPVNPMTNVKRPRKKREDKPNTPETLTTEQIQLVQARLANEPIWTRAFIGLLISSGCRAGEACALEWKNVDFHTGSIVIEHSLSNSGQIGDTKTHQSRTVYVGASCLATLRELRQAQSQACLSKWVFSRPGQVKPVTPTAAEKIVVRFGDKIGVRLHAHMLRHTWATLSLQAGASPSDVAAQLGHSSTQMTLNVYSHSDAQSQQRAAKVFQEAIGENK